MESVVPLPQVRLWVDEGEADSTTLTLSGAPSAEFKSKEIGTVSISIRKYGWISQDGKKYYYDATGTMVTGWVEIDGTWYYFDETGDLVKSSANAPNE